MDILVNYIWKDGAKPTGLPTPTDPADAVNKAYADAIGGLLHFEAVFGDGTATEFDFTHNFGTRHFIASVRRAISPWDDVTVAIQRPDLNTVRVLLSEPPLENELSIMLLSTTALVAPPSASTEDDDYAAWYMTGM